MNERYAWSPETYDRNAFFAAIEDVTCLGDYRDFLHKKLADISVTSFLKDIEAQERFFALSKIYAPRTKMDKDIPVVTLHTINTTDAGKVVVGGTLSHQFQRFPLRDDFRLYYFTPVQNDSSEDPHKDSYTINRVLRIGGQPQQYDVSTGEWKLTRGEYYRGMGKGNTRMQGIQQRVLGSFTSQQ